jgi:DNA-binding MarR family transcriptional regulator
VGSGKERLFWTGSTNILADPRPSALDLRVYGCVSKHDGMSLYPGKTGRGCYATLATIAAEVGSDVTNVSKSLKRLVGWGYLTEERQKDGRRRTYRVVFEDGETWRNRQQSEGRTLAKSPTIETHRLAKSPTIGAEIVGGAESRNRRNPPQTEQHYIPLKGLDPSEEELNSPEGARSESSEPLRPVAALTIDANLALLNRALKEDRHIDLIGWGAALLAMLEAAEDSHRRNQVHRLFDDLACLMTDAEMATAEKEHEAAVARKSQSKVVSIKEASRRRGQP